MRVFVTAKPLAKKERVETTDGIHFMVAVKEPPKEGKANAAILWALAAHLDVPPSRIRMVSGFSSREKVFEVE